MQRTVKDVLNRIKALKEETYNQSLKIDFRVVFPESDETLLDNIHPSPRRNVRDSIRGSVDIVAAVEALADSLAVRSIQQGVQKDN